MVWKIIRVEKGQAPKLTNKGYEVVIHEWFTKGHQMNLSPSTRYWLVKDGKQIDGFDVVQTKVYSYKPLKDLLDRNKISVKDNVTIFIK